MWKAGRMCCQPGEGALKCYLASKANLVTPGNKQMLCLRKIKQQGGLALILSRVVGGRLLVSAEIFPELRNADFLFRHEANCPPVASPAAHSTSQPQCVSQGFCFHFDI